MEEFRFNWQLIGLLLVSGQGLLFLVVLLLQRRSNRRANLVLASLVALLLWHHVDFIINTSFWYQVFPYLYTPNYLSWFLFGPLVYLYIKYLLEPDYQPGLLVKLSFLPAVISAANYFGLYTMDTTTKVELIKRTAILNETELSTFFEPAIHGSIIFTGQLLVLSAALASCVYELRRAASLKGIDRDRQLSWNLRWLYFVVAAFTVAAMISNFYFRAIWVAPVLTLDTLYLYIAPLTVFLVILETRAFLQPETYTRLSAQEESVGKYLNSTLSDKELQQIVNRLQDHMAENSPYLQSDLRIAHLSRDLHIPVNHLSQAINQKLGKSFTELINQYRISEAQKILDADRSCEVNLLAVALEVGFNNKTSFLNAFKKNLEMSPSSYLRSLQQQNQSC